MAARLLNDGQLAAVDELFAAGQRGLTDRIADCLSRLFEQEDREAEGGDQEGGAPEAEGGGQEGGDQRVTIVRGVALVACWNDRGSFLTVLWNGLCNLPGARFAERVFNEGLHHLLHRAASFGSTGAIQALLGLRRPKDGGAALCADALDAACMTPLDHAVSQRHVGAARFLLGSNASVEGGHYASAYCTSGSVGTPLAVATAQNDFPMMRLLLESEACLDEEPLYAAVSRGHCKMIRALAQAKADMNLKYDYGGTALHTAVRNDQVRAVSTILALKGDAEVRDVGNRTPLMLARKRAVLTGDANKVLCALERLLCVWMC